MTDAENIRAKAHCALSDLRFLLPLIPQHRDIMREIAEAHIQALENPTDETINAAWRLAAIIHDEIRNA